jgi:hypothetical protein
VQGGTLSSRNMRVNRWSGRLTSKDSYEELSAHLQNHEFKRDDRQDLRHKEVEDEKEWPVESKDHSPASISEVVRLLALIGFFTFREESSG